MINLIRNELTKILSKKAIWIYSLIIFILTFGMSVLTKNLAEDGNPRFTQSYIDSLEEGLSFHDLSTDYGLNMYIGDRTLIDSNKISLKYKYESPEYYYVQETIQPLIQEKYGLEYRDKDLEAVKLVQAEIDKEVSKLDNFDWKYQILQEKELVNQSIKDIEELLNTDKDNKDYQNMLEELKIELWCLNYRLDNGVAYSYSSKSDLVNDYKDYSIKYLTAIKDESKIKDQDDLRANREVISNYEVAKYKLENNMTEENSDMIDYITSSMAYIDGFIIIAIIIIVGSIVAEEFNKGTIKQLLTKPFSRGKILTSKIVAALIVSIIFIVLYEIVFVLANCYEYSDFTTIFSNSVVYDFNLGKVREISVLGMGVNGLLAVMPAYLIIFAIVMFMGTLSTSTVAAMCTGFGVYFFYDLINMLLSPKILAFIPFYTWDLSPYLYGGLNSNIHATLGKSLFIDILTVLVLIVGSYIIFSRKEIKNQ